jgi:hypothetical protein
MKRVIVVCGLLLCAAYAAAEPGPRAPAAADAVAVKCGRCGQPCGPNMFCDIFLACVPPDEVACD